MRTIVTMLLSALWHGYAAGYYFCICQVPLYLPFEDIGTKFYNQSDPNGFVSKFIIKNLYIFLFMNFLV